MTNCDILLYLLFTGGSAFISHNIITILMTTALFYFSYTDSDANLINLFICGFLVFNLLSSIGSTDILSRIVWTMVDNIRNMNFYNMSLVVSSGLLLGTYIPIASEDDMIYIPLVVCGVGILGVFSIYLLGLLFSLYKSYTAVKEVIIVRGVPGIGKRNYIAWLESKFENGGDFRVCYWQDYFGRGTKYSFNPMLVKKAEMWSLMNFVRGIMSGTNRIYVLSTFEHIWQYDIYTTIAKVCGYKYRIVELECLSERHLRHYSERSRHMIPYSKSLSVFHSWETDPRAVLQEPYHEPSWNGDSVPLYDDSITQEILDDELGDYLSGVKTSTVNEMRCSHNRRTTEMIGYVSDFDKMFIGL